ncbi:MULTISPECIES: hypothetical protein [unclassified Coleofasciculus]|uniref:hypothetical protein n=1 Tax=unclassified Coleofasciculus TaxID=2692782 RepID=UPI00187E5415|nr:MULTISPECIES: hypothetical protein [unclassified Coleofasciculus]MBE9125569.1 hypothetical protein [Coleofasciculus sp. LEGE 07081]MBE9147796.1 hypothetical protein [Coleofasciculus sp. LEGE 07092]
MLSLVQTNGYIEESLTAMEYWEFLLQKEGDRSWLPVKSAKIELEAGRYRVVVHSNRINTDVEICLTHQSTDEVPPKRRYQKRSCRTNPEGLMVVIPFTYLKPGLWELRCCGDIMSDFLGDSWQEAVQLQIVPTVRAVLPTDTPTSAAEMSEPTAEPEQVPAHSDSEPVAELKPPEPEASLLKLLAATDTVQTNGSEPASVNSDFNPSVEPHLTETETETEVVPLAPLTTSDTTQTDVTETVEPEPYQETTLTNTEDTNADFPPPVTAKKIEIPEPEIPVTNGTNGTSTVPNPILEQSLQMLEEVLQQVIDPVIQEFEQPEPPDSEPAVTSESELPLLSETQWQGLILTLDEEAVVAKGKEPLTITGQVDVLDVNQLHGCATVDSGTTLFQGTLHYELRHPQTSQVLLDIRKPLSAQTLPLTFSHTLDMPPDGKSCLLLGKVSLYESTSHALASQPFTVTVDLDELLETIQSNSEAVSEENGNSADILNQDSDASVSANQSWLDLVDFPQNRQTLLSQPSSKQFLPPQIYQQPESQGVSKPLDLPSFAKVVDSVEVKLETQATERSHFVALVPADQSKEQAPTSPADSTEEQEQQHLETKSEEFTSSEGRDTADEGVKEKVSSLPSPSDTQINDTVNNQDEVPSLEKASSVADSELDTSKTTEISDVWESTTESEPETSQNALPKALVSQPVVEVPTEVDRAFQALNVEDRFWLRLNALVGDNELSEWLKSELLLCDAAAEAREEEEMASKIELDSLSTEIETVFPEVEDATLPPGAGSEMSDFDESIWDEDTEEFGSVSSESAELKASVEPEKPRITDPAEWNAREIVVDDEQLSEEEPSGDGSNGAATSKISTQPKPESSSRLDRLPPLPTPELYIPAMELAAGEPVLVRVKLASHPARLGVKLWVQDRQSRSLLDGPRWLMDLIPNESGELEALTQLVVPFGTVEIRFEAIAVELDSDRESHKVSVDCGVIPPDLLNISLDDFGA